MFVGRRGRGLVLGLLVALVGVVALAGPSPLGPTAPVDARADYRDRFAPELLGRQSEIDRIAGLIETDPAIGGRANRYADEELPRATALLAMVESYRPPSARIAAVHEHAVAAARLSRQAEQEVALSYRHGGDTALLARARRHSDDAARRWRHWLDALLAR